MYGHVHIRDFEKFESHGVYLPNWDEIRQHFAFLLQLSYSRWVSLLGSIDPNIFVLFIGDYIVYNDPQE